MEHYEDIVSEGVRVLTVFEQQKMRWVSMVKGGPLDGWSVANADADPVIQHAEMIEALRRQG